LEIKNHILSAKNLSIGYTSKKKKTVISSNLNLELHRGELVCLLGKNGIGKSTLLRTLTKVQQKISGEIRLQGQILESYTSNELAKQMSIVLTEKIPQSNLTVYELIALGRQPYTNWLGTLTMEDKNQIRLALDHTGLGDLLHKRSDELSDGQLQRVMICRALAQNTDIIILDEPTAHLDIQHKIETFQLLKDLAHQLNKSILISSHEIQLALQMGDVLWLMNEREILSGKPKTLIENNKINLLFDTDAIYFDKEKSQFLIK